MDFSPALFFVTSSGTTRLCHKGGHGGAAMRGNGKDQRGVVVRLPLARRSCARQPLTLLSSVTPFPASLRVRGARRCAVQRGGLRHGQGACGRHRSASPGDEWLHGVRGLLRLWRSPWGRGGGVQTPGVCALPSTHEPLPMSHEHRHRATSLCVARRRSRALGCMSAWCTRRKYGDRRLLTDRSDFGLRRTSHRPVRFRARTAMSRSGHVRRACSTRRPATKQGAWRHGCVVYAA